MDAVITELKYFMTCIQFTLCRYRYDDLMEGPQFICTYILEVLLSIPHHNIMEGYRTRTKSLHPLWGLQHMDTSVTEWWTRCTVHMYYTDTIMTEWHTDMNTFRTSWGDAVHGCNHDIRERLQYMKTIIMTGFAVLISDGRFHYHSLHISPQTAVVTGSSKWVYIK